MVPADATDTFRRSQLLFDLSRVLTDSLVEERLSSTSTDKSCKRRASTSSTGSSRSHLPRQSAFARAMLTPVTGASTSSAGSGADADSSAPTVPVSRSSTVSFRGSTHSAARRSTITVISDFVKVQGGRGGAGIGRGVAESFGKEVGSASGMGLARA